MTIQDPNSNQDVNAGMVWPLPILGLVSLVVVTGVSILVFMISKRSLYDELEYTIAIVAFILFFFLSDGLYTGARLEGKPTAPNFDFLKAGYAAFDAADALSALEILGETVTWIAISIAILLVLVFLATVLWAAVLALGFMLYWLLYRAIRIVLLKGPKCRGNLKLSFLYAAWYSFLYCGWIFAIVWLAEHRPWQ
jgi:hypothetical protein